MKTILVLVILSFGWAFMQSSYIVQKGDTLYSIARSFDVTVDELASLNQLENINKLRLGQTLLVKADINWPEPLPQPFAHVTLSPKEARQGEVQTLKIELADNAELTSVNFQDQNYQGDNTDLLVLSPVLQTSGIKDLEIRATIAGQVETLSLPVVVKSAGFAKEEIWLDSETSSLLEPSIVSKEHALVEDTCKNSAATPKWQGDFRHPVDNAVVTSAFGTLRSYNGGPYRNFHRGIDYRGDSNTPVYAAADGVVSLSEELSVRGNMIIIDHGFGVCSGYAHLSQRLLQVGSSVQAGDLLGYIGNTGLVTGPHLHWEVRVNGVPVSPEQWLFDAPPQLTSQ